MSFIFYNPNPSGKRTGDCVIRAIAKATGQDWERAYTNLCVEGYTLYDFPSSNRVWGSYLQSRGFEKIQLPNTCPDCYTVKQFCEDNPNMLNDATSAKEKDAIHQCIEKLQNM